MKIICKKYFDGVRLFHFLQKIFIKRPGENCGYLICKTPFTKKDYSGRKFRLVFCITRKLRPIIIEEHRIESIMDYFNSCHYQLFPINPYDDLVQIKSHISLMTTYFNVRNFANYNDVFRHDHIDVESFSETYNDYLKMYDDKFSEGRRKLKTALKKPKRVGKN